MEWVPMIVVLGEKERASEKVPVRLRSGDVKQMTRAEMAQEIDRLGKDYPGAALPLPRMLSKRPAFRG
jgi:threonyl-tRNA synthetase